ncbi:MAG: FAD-dependent oxidoreductase [Candidatus Limnocylindrales bacterium]
MSAKQSGRSADLVVVGAGAMGAWTAFWAQAGGAGYDGRAGGGRAVTMLDAWGTGHPRASSGDETRIIRSAHGADRLYTRWSRQARDHWLRFEREWGARLMVQAGALWFASRETGFEGDSIAALQTENVPHERLAPAELVARWPQIGADEALQFGLYEPESGVLMARRACAAVTAAFQRAGGRYVLAAVRPGESEGGRLLDVVEPSGARWSAETFVFACGPWLPRLFPDELGKLIRVTKQDVLFVGAGAGDGRFRAPALPAWADYDAAYYGIPAIDERGFKIAPDRYGPLFDPSNGERLVDPDSVRLARRYLRRRFPGLADRPVVESRVCQYEMTPDGHFLIDRHPAYDNVWIAGGGSGHAFKHGPRIGEYLVTRLDGAEEMAQDGPDEARFRLGPRVSQAAARTGGDDMASNWELF